MEYLGLAIVIIVVLALIFIGVGLVRNSPPVKQKDSLK